MVSNRDRPGFRQLNIALEEKYHRVLKKVSFQHGITVSDIIRQYCAFLQHASVKDLRPLNAETRISKFRFSKPDN